MRNKKKRPYKDDLNKDNHNKPYNNTYSHNHSTTLHIVSMHNNKDDQK